MKDFLHPFDIANEIRMLRSDFEGTFFVVEGETDFRLFSNFVNRGNCQIKTAYDKEKALAIHAILSESNFSGFLVIVDNDFWEIDHQSKPSNITNLYTTDSHDIETMILQSPALEKILTEYGSQEKINNFGSNIRKILLQIGVYIGYLRFISLKEKLSLCFENLNFSNFIDKKNLTINLAGLVEEVTNKSNKQNMREHIRKKVEKMASNSYDLWQMCCGHDLVCILSLGLRFAFGSNNAGEVKQEIIEKSLRLAYEFTYFQETKLYLDLIKWEQTNTPFIIFQ